MSLVRTRDTDPERRLRSILHRRGLRFRVNRRLTTGPACYADLAFGPSRVAVFVDGCYWHGCPQHASWPKSNAEWWREKIAKNQRRDGETTRRLRDTGWLVIRIWEHDDPTCAAAAIEEAVISRRPGTRSSI